MNYYNINTALFNYVSLRASSTVAFHPTVKTVGFPGLHFVRRVRRKTPQRKVQIILKKQYLKRRIVKMLNNLAAAFS